ncbi:MAG: hypothetical protein R2838_04695 [Caldilineaceae bacterium]
MTLYLHSDAAMDENYQLFLQLVDPAGRPIANITSHPGWGRNPTSIRRGRSMKTRICCRSPGRWTTVRPCWPTSTSALSTRPARRAISIP